MNLFRLALASLRHRGATSLLTLSAIGLAAALLLTVELARASIRDSFAQSVSGADLIVGARGGATQLLLYSVFGLDSPTRSVSWDSYRRLAGHPAVAWSLPISLGDSHRGFRVIGTQAELFTSWRYRRDRALAFSAGRPFRELYDAVLGADVAADLGYRPGSRLALAHGDGALFEHGDTPFQVVGVLAPSGTPFDRAVFVSLEAIEAIHVGWQAGIPPRPGESAAPPDRLPITQVSAIFLKARSRLDLLRLQSEIEEMPEEPLSAILPGVALTDLWRTLRHAETGLRWISGLVVLVGGLTMAVVLLASLEARRREMAILRALGVGPRRIFALLVLEASLLSVAGVALAIALTYGGLGLTAPWIEQRAGIEIALGLPSPTACWSLLAVVVFGSLTALGPGMRAYRYSLADALTIR
jgi:putative ABC transport system permease protein